MVDERSSGTGILFLFYVRRFLREQTLVSGLAFLNKPNQCDPVSHYILSVQ